MDNQTRNHLNLQKHIADQDHIIRVRNAEIAALRKRTEKAEMESGRAAEVAERWREAYDDLVSLRHADPYRPLNPDAITDEMVERAGRTYVRALGDRGYVVSMKAAHTREAFGKALAAALTEPVECSEVVALAEVLGDFAVADEHNGTRDDMGLARALHGRGVRVIAKEEPR